MEPKFVLEGRSSAKNAKMENMVLRHRVEILFLIWERFGD